MNRPFLTADWNHLLFAHFPISDEKFFGVVPKGIEPDRFENRCWVSLVGFRFQNTRVWGLGWPGFRNFPEWNLRIYVRCGNERGVLFIREYVQSRMIAATARGIYNEPYCVAKLENQIQGSGAVKDIRYRVEMGNRWSSLYARISGKAVQPEPGSAEWFFTNQSWGFGRSRRGQLYRYAVQHPLWNIETVDDGRVDVDWDLLYGSEWAELNKTEPERIMYAVGSEVAVYHANRVTE